MPNWMEHLAACAAAGTDAILVSVAGAKGSTPRDSGSKMLVSATDVFDSIGGGDLERRATDLARAMLSDADAPAIRRFPLGAEPGHVCGGRVDLVFERIGPAAAWIETLHRYARSGGDFVMATSVGAADGAASKLFVSPTETSGSLGSETADALAVDSAHALIASDDTVRWVDLPGDARGPLLLDAIRVSDFRIVVFGAGHVGRLLVSMLGEIPCSVTWVDNRPGQMPPTLPANVRALCREDPVTAVDDASPGSYFVVMSHSHDIDANLAARILERADFRFFGLLGSAPKRRQVERRLEAAGIPAARATHMVCPIGLPGIRGKQPGVIAVAVAAQLLLARESSGAAAEPGERALA